MKAFNFSVTLILPESCPTFNYILNKDGECIQVFWKERKWISKEDAKEFLPESRIKS